MPFPLSAQADARNRSWRTLWQGLLLDLAVVLLPLAYDALSGWDGAGGRAYWTAVGVSLGKTAALTVVAYIARLVKTPPGGQPA